MKAQSKRFHSTGLKLFKTVPLHQSIQMIHIMYLSFKVILGIVSLVNCRYCSCGINKCHDVETLIAVLLVLICFTEEFDISISA